LDAVDGNVYTSEFLAKGVEPMEDQVKRMVRFVTEIRKKHKGHEVIVVSHGDPIRFAIMHYKGMPIDYSLGRSVATPLAGGYRISFSGQTMSKVEPIKLD